MSWREKVDPIIKDYLELQIKETTKFDAYKEAKNPAVAQLWIAIANLSKQIFNLELKAKYLEKALQDIGGKKEIKEGEVTKEILSEILKKAPIKKEKEEIKRKIVKKGKKR